MHIQIVTFKLNGLSEGEYRKMCDQVAPALAGLQGLIAKIFLANAETNTYGGVYTWQDREAMVAFSRSEIFAAVANNPQLTDVRSTDFGVLEEPTQVTHGLVAVAA